jgi:hypothetical protein
VTQPELPSDHSSSAELCVWAKRVNATWLVQGGLDATAEEYLRHLEATDCLRLDQSCRNARRLLANREPSEDPKAWFYAGLFSLARPEEIERFLQNHWMTRAAVMATAVQAPDGVSNAALQKLRRIRDALSRMLKPTMGPF